MAWIRKNVWDLIATPNDQTLYWYARGVAAMQQRPITDPTSWLFQGAVHGRPGWPDEPEPGSPWAQLPRDVRETFWDQCQHRTWFFLPWHRIYVGYFERMVRAAIVAEGGPEDWALPYWNYSKSAEQALLPTPFRQPTLDDGSPNPLYIAERNPRWLRRNALVALGNVGDPDDTTVTATLDRFATGDDDLLAEHARWAIARRRSRSGCTEPPTRGLRTPRTARGGS